MDILFDGFIHASYYQFYIESPERSATGNDGCFTNQVNGLCGASAAGLLCCTTGVHSGEVPLVIELHDGPPEGFDANGNEESISSWEEIVEVSLLSTSRVMILSDWGHEKSIELALGEGVFRVRYHASGMQAAKEADVRLAGDPILDRYLLQFWRVTSPEHDAVLRVTSDIATSWHAIAHNGAAPRLEGLQDENWTAHAEHEERAAYDLMISKVAAGSSARQRFYARSLAHQAVRLASSAIGQEFSAWVQPALNALDHDQLLPYPFDGDQASSTAIKAGILQLARGPGSMDQSQERALVKAASFAIRTVQAASDSSPTRAFTGALTMVQNVQPSLQQELRTEFINRFS